jgi:hypothetical protein
MVVFTMEYCFCLVKMLLLLIKSLVPQIHVRPASLVQRRHFDGGTNVFVKLKQIFHNEKRGNKPK